MPSTTAKLGAPLQKRIRDYAVNEPSFTIPFMAWELKISSSAATLGVAELLRKEIVQEIEPQAGPYAATYAYVKPTRKRRPRAGAQLHVLSTTHPTPAELQDRELAYVTEGAA